MINVVAFWEFGWNTPIMEMDLWHYPLKDFDVDKFYMVPISGIKNKNIIERSSLKEVLDENKDLQVVFITEVGETKLKDFEHPKNVLYILGRTNYSPFNNLKREQDLSLKIETNNNKGGLWGHQCISIVLYDRLIKNHYKNGSNNSR